MCKKIWENKRVLVHSFEKQSDAVDSREEFGHWKTNPRDAFSKVFRSIITDNGPEMKKSSARSALSASMIPYARRALEFPQSLTCYFR